MKKAVTILVLVSCVLAVGSERTITAYSEEASKGTSSMRDNGEGIRTVTAYTLGREEENDSDPCIGAYNDDLCEINKNGIQTCASNEFTYKTKIEVRIGKRLIKCIVMDRMNRRYADRVDVAFLDYNQAIEFGRNDGSVKVIR